MSPVNRSAFASAASGGGGPRKSPLRLASDPVPVVSAGPSRAPEALADGGFRRADLSPAQRRQVMISEYGEWLRTLTNRHGRPFQAETISAYRDAAVALSAWMTSEGMVADFTGCDTAVLNRFSAPTSRRTARACGGWSSGGPSRPGMSRRCTRTCSDTPSRTTGKWAELHLMQHSPESVITAPEGMPTETAARLQLLALAKLQVRVGA